MRSTLGTIIGGAALIAAIALPAGAAVSPSAASHRGHQACYGHHSQERSRDCTDERHPQHDGRGSILF